MFAAPDMTFDMFMIMLAVLKERAVRTIDIIGGEPTLHSAIVPFVSESLRSGFCVNISSNGTDLNLIEELMGMGSRVTVGISVNDREMLDQTGSFIERHKPIVKSVFLPGMEQSMIREILSLKPKKYCLIYRDALSRSELQAAISFSRFTAAAEQLFGPTEGDTVFCSGFLPDTKCYPELAHVRCPAGTTKLGIMPDGSVYPCNLFFGKKEFLLGNILTDPFESIWHHQSLDFFRSAVLNNCPETSCELHARCHGGCPAHSYTHAGILSAPDPRCVR
jgi:radical SAM protein with 4Fe4S-binding SPASM domain